MTGVLIRRGDDTQRNTKRGRPHKDRGRDWNKAATSQGTRTDGNHQKLEEAKRDSL